jgi:hypothetical protein
MGLGHQPLEQLGLGQRFGPRLEDLQHIGAGLRLHHQIGRRRLGEQIDQRLHALRLGERDRPGSGASLRPAEADQHVGRQRPRPAREADQRPFRLQFGAHALQRLGDISEPGRHFLDRRRHGFERRQRPEPRTFPGLEPHLLAERDGHQEDIGEDHRRIVGEPAHRLQRHLGRDPWIRAERQHVLHVRPQRHVLWQAAPSLAHEPDGRPLQRLPVDGAKQVGPDGVHAAP